MEGNERTITKHDEQINNLVNQIISNSKDEAKARELIHQLGGLYQMDKIIDVPLKDVTDKLDLGANVLYKVRDGYVWECKGGMTTHVSVRMAAVCTMLQTVFYLNAKADKTDEENELFESFSTAVAYVMECPIFSAMSEESLFANATAILKQFNDYVTEHYTNAEAVEETEEDIKANNEMEALGRVVENLADAPLPPEVSTED